MNPDEIKKMTDDELFDAAGSAAPPQVRVRKVSPIQAQAELTRRLMESIRNAGESTSRYSDALMVLTFVLCVIGLLQLATSVLPVPNSTPIRVGLFVCFIAVIIWTFWQGVKDWRE